MSLWVNNRAAVKGPGTHALIIGTSYYPYLPGGDKYPPNHNRTFDLQQVRIAATGAWRFANWLKSDEYALNAKAPLASIRLLLSPSDEEKEHFPELKTLPAQNCTTAREAVRQALLDWKEDCQHRDSVAIFYVTGHGVAKSKLESYVLLADFAKDNLVMDYSLDPRGVRDGMAGDSIARTQFYFIDACRDNVEEFRQVRNMGTPLSLDEEYGGSDERTWSMYFSTSPARKSYGMPGEGTFYSTALMDCLTGPARWALIAPDDRASLSEEKTKWHISNISLGLALKTRVDEIVAESNRRELAAGAIIVPRKQTVLPEGIFNASLLTVWQEPPKLFIEVNVEPEGMAANAKARLQDGTNRIVCEDKPCVPRPLRFDDLTAVLYLLEVELQSGAKRKGPIVLAPKLPGIQYTVQF